MVALLTSLFLLFHAGFQDLPHAFPRPGATQLVDNARLTAWDVIWPKNQSSGMHRHAYDYVGIELNDSLTTVTRTDGQPRTVSMKKAMAYFLPKGTTHLEEGLSDVPRHAILVDLKDAPSPAYPNKTGLPAAFPRDGARKILENPRVVIWDYAWTPGKPTPMHFHDKDVFLVFLEGGELKSTTPDGQATVRTISANESQFNPGNRAHTEEMTKGAVRAIIVELK
jgi:hypothetical protein